ncbi:MAG TPA: phosphoserine phosphatase SerB [Acidimicrobiia bacterium]|nr:phosphoserine phosphatase SerB [Acidimicrobiia bacterium]
MSSIILARISGLDGPGITAGLMEVLAQGDCTLYDVEQIVLRDRLSLSVLISVPEGQQTVRDVLFYAWEQGLQADFEVVDEDISTPVRPRFAVTVIGAQISPEAFGAVANAIASAGGNIDSIERLSRYPVISYELAVSGGDQAAMRSSLLVTSAGHDVDVAVQAEGLTRRSKRLIVLDVDSTLIQDEVIDLLADEAGVAAEVAELTARAMTGEIDFAASLTRRVALLRDLPVDALERVWDRIRLTPGARTFVRTLHRMGMKIAIVSGGFTVFTERLKTDLGLDHAYGNELEIADGRLTGRLTGPPIDRARKASILKEVARVEGIPLDQTVAIGDGANDLDMLAVAGLGIAFNAKPVVRDAAHTAVSVPYLDAILFLLGIRRDEVEAADSGDQTDRIPVAGLPPV